MSYHPCHYCMGTGKVAFDSTGLQTTCTACDGTKVLWFDDPLTPDEIIQLRADLEVAKEQAVQRKLEVEQAQAVTERLREALRQIVYANDDDGAAALRYYATRALSLAEE